MLAQEPVAELVAGGSPLLRAAFSAVTLVTTGLFVAAVWWSAIRTGLAAADSRRRASIAAILSGIWIVATGVAAASGALRFDPPPPTMVALLVAVLALAVGIAVSSLGRRLAVGIPIAALVGFQGFRVLVELSMHRAYSEGIMPIQMSYSGRNFDVVTGLTAIVLGLWLATGERRNWRPVVFAWNTVGMLLLINILAVALLSAPTPFRKFMNEPANVFVTRAPYVWLPAVMVLAAILGHLLVYRRLRIA